MQCLLSCSRIDNSNFILFTIVAGGAAGVGNFIGTSLEFGRFAYKGAHIQKWCTFLLLGVTPLDVHVFHTSVFLYRAEKVLLIALKTPNEDRAIQDTAVRRHLVLRLVLFKRALYITLPTLRIDFFFSLSQGPS